MSKTSGSAAIREQASGPVFTKNDPAKFHGPGKSSGKTPANGVVDGSPHGITFTCNETHIPTMNADKAPKESKSMGEHKGEDPYEKSLAKNASDVGSSGGQPTYSLKKSYEK